MIIALTAEEDTFSEHAVINALFEEGLDILHLRKYHFTDLQMSRYIASINAVYLDKLVLHSHAHLSADLGISRIHVNEKSRQNGPATQIAGAAMRSTSVHHIDHFNSLEGSWDYAFLSPLFPSISKAGYGKDNALLKQLPLRSNAAVRLIGLGGINQSNCLLPIQEGADGIALYGALWKHSDPIENFIACKQKLWKDSNIFHRGKH